MDTAPKMALTIKKWITKVNKSEAFAIDTETDSVNTVSANLIGISLSVSENEGCYIPIAHSYEDCPKQLSMDYVVETLGPTIEKNQEKAVGQNYKFKIKNGLITSIFLINYGLSRIIIENFREPDFQLGLKFDFISQGQILSVPIVILGFIFLYLCQFKQR